MGIDTNKIITDRISARMHQRNQNCLILICGGTGTGKSLQALKLGEILDPDFNIRNVALGAQEFMDALQSDWLKKGSVVVFDEAGVGIPARDWYSLQNKLLGYVFQTFRHMNITCIFTVPNMSFIDVQLRCLFHLYLETKTISYRNKTSESFVFYLAQRSRDAEVIPYRPTYREQPVLTTIGKIRKIHTMTFTLPSDKLVAAYEKKKNKYSKQLRDNATRTIKKLKDKEEGTFETKKDKILEAHNKGMRNKDIAKKFNTSPRYVSDTISSST